MISIIANSFKFQHKPKNAKINRNECNCGSNILYKNRITCPTYQSQSRTPEDCMVKGFNVQTILQCIKAPS